MFPHAGTITLPHAGGFHDLEYCLAMGLLVGATSDNISDAAWVSAGTEIRFRRGCTPVGTTPRLDVISRRNITMYSPFSWVKRGKGGIFLSLTKRRVFKDTF